MKLLYTVIVFLVMLFIITFSLENTEPVSLQYLEYRIVVKTYMLLFISFLAGVVFAGSWALWNGSGCPGRSRN